MFCKIYPGGEKIQHMLSSWWQHSSTYFPRPSVNVFFQRSPGTHHKASHFHRDRMNGRRSVNCEGMKRWCPRRGKVVKTVKGEGPCTAHTSPWGLPRYLLLYNFHREGKNGRFMRNPTLNNVNSSLYWLLPLAQPLFYLFFSSLLRVMNFHRWMQLFPLDIILPCGAVNEKFKTFYWWPALKVGGGCSRMWRNQWKKKISAHARAPKYKE
jgi:hypothetical protein